MDSEQLPEEIPEVIPVPKRHRPRRVCPHCGGDDITKGLRLFGSTGGQDIGIKCAAGGILGILAFDAEPLRVDLCNSCGSVTRIYVKRTERKWS